MQHVTDLFSNINTRVKRLTEYRSCPFPSTQCNVDLYDTRKCEIHDQNENLKKIMLK